MRNSNNACESWATRRRRIIKEAHVLARAGPHGILRVITEVEVEYLLDPVLRELDALEDARGSSSSR